MAVVIKPLNAELNPICSLLALLGAHHILHVSRISVKLMLMPRNEQFESRFTGKGKAVLKPCICSMFKSQL
jgi:hypothetical protein